MKRAYTIIILLLALQPASLWSAERIIMTEQTSLSGLEYELIEIAVKEARKKQINPSNYKITLYNEGDTYIVILSDPEIAEYQFGGSEKMPTFEVSIDSNFNIIKSNFAR